MLEVGQVEAIRAPMMNDEALGKAMLYKAHDL
jgi:hypothetical protein